MSALGVERTRKPCLGCGGPKPPGRGLRRCDDCSPIAREARRTRGRGDPERSLRTRYHLTVNQYEALAERQGDLCAICRTPRPSVGRLSRLAVDHNHDTDEVRGLLCQRCNMALHFLENEEWLASARHYLEAPPARDCSPVLAGESA